MNSPRPLANFLDYVSAANDIVPFNQVGWEGKVHEYLAFVDRPLDYALRPATVRLRVRDIVRSLILHLGATGLLEVIWAAQAGDFRIHGERMVSEDAPVFVEFINAIVDEESVKSIVRDLSKSVR